MGALIARVQAGKGLGPSRERCGYSRCSVQGPPVMFQAAAGRHWRFTAVVELWWTLRRMRKRTLDVGIPQLPARQSTWQHCRRRIKRSGRCRRVLSTMDTPPRRNCSVPRPAAACHRLLQPMPIRMETCPGRTHAHTQCWQRACQSHFAKPSATEVARQLASVQT